MRTNIRGMKGEWLVLLYAIRHRSTPLLPKAVAALSLIYLLSPFDFIPDFIPFAGWLDDLVIVPLLLHLSYRLLPARVIEESRTRSLGQRRRLQRTFWVLIAVFLLLMAGIYWFYHSRG